MKLDIKLKNSFFDRHAVVDKVEKARVTVLSRIGAFMRTRARSMLRKRKRISNPGQAPSVHTSDPTISLKNVQFGYDFSSRSVVVGPIPLNGKNGGTPVPELLEFGGTVTRKGKTLHYAARQFMGPTLQKEIAAGTLPPHWKNSVKGS